MPNINGNAYGLSVLCPILQGGPDASERSHASLLREKLDALELDERSPMARVPETYLCRLFVLNDVIYQGVDEHKWIPTVLPAKRDALKSKYLVFVVDFHGTSPDDYLRGMWDHAQEMIQTVWQHCVEFQASVHNGSTFADYIRRCQVETTFNFNGSNDESLAEQLKGLYLKQELSDFAFKNQHATPKELKEAFDAFLLRTQPSSLSGPTWVAGASDPASAQVDAADSRLADQRDSDIRELSDDNNSELQEAS